MVRVAEPARDAQYSLLVASAAASNGNGFHLSPVVPHDSHAEKNGRDSARRPWPHPSPSPSPSASEDDERARLHTASHTPPGEWTSSDKPRWSAATLALVVFTVINALLLLAHAHLTAVRLSQAVSDVTWTAQSSNHTSNASLSLSASLLPDALSPLLNASFPLSATASSANCPALSAVPIAGFRSAAVLPVTPGRALIVIVLVHSNELYRQNLAYLIHKGVRCWQDADYRILVQRDDAAMLNAAEDTFHSDLPALPPNARYVLHQNQCWDWGSFGWLLGLPPSHRDHVNTSRYRYFAMVNTGIRGPMLPDYLEERMDLDHSASCDPDEAQQRGLVSWFDVFLTKLKGDTRYVGSTINCAFAAHVQSYAVFLDFVALQVLWRSHVPTDWLSPEAPDSSLRNGSREVGATVLRDFEQWQAVGGVAYLGEKGHILGCEATKDEAIMVSEVGSSQAIVRAGFNIGSLMRTWQDVDFRDQPPPCAANAGGKGWDALVDPIHIGAPVDRTEARGATVMMDPLWMAFGKWKDKGGSQSYWRLKALLGWETVTHEYRMRKLAEANVSLPTEPSHASLYAIERWPTTAPSDRPNN